MSYFEPIHSQSERLSYKRKITKKQQLSEQNQKKKLISKPYPFSKRGIISYILSNKFLSSINYDFKSQLVKKKNGKITLSRPLDDLILEEIYNQIPFERKIEEIQNEKVRRHQAYTSLNYYLSQLTYFDFFAYDSFKIINQAKIIAQFYKQDLVTPELLILPFFNPKLAIGRLLRKYGLHKTIFQKILMNLKDLSSLTKSDMLEKDLLESSKFDLIKQNNIFQNFWLNLKLNFKGIITNYIKIEDNEIKFRFFEPLNQGISFSYEVHEIFEKSAQNASKRFKTVIITPEVLLLTIIEEENLNLSQEIRKELADEIGWQLFRYRLLKYLYYQESTLKSYLEEDQYFFGYLFKTKISEKKFGRLVEKNRIKQGVSLFRNALIVKILKFNLYENFDKETHEAIISSPNRFYSTNFNL